MMTSVRVTCAGMAQATFLEASAFARRRGHTILGSVRGAISKLASGGRRETHLQGPVSAAAVPSQRTQGAHGTTAAAVLPTTAATA